MINFKMKGCFVRCSFKPWPQVKCHVWKYFVNTLYGITCKEIETRFQTFRIRRYLGKLDRMHVLGIRINVFKAILHSHSRHLFLSLDNTSQLKAFIFPCGSCCKFCFFCLLLLLVEKGGSSSLDYINSVVMAWV